MKRLEESDTFRSTWFSSTQKSFVRSFNEDSQSSYNFDNFPKSGRHRTFRNRVCVKLCALCLIFTRLLHSILYTYIHGTILQTGITWKKIPCYIRNSAFLRKLKYFEVILKIFEFSQVWENVKYWLVYANKLFWITQPYLDRHNKTKLVLASFSCF